MIGQYLPNKNKNATIPKTNKFLEINKALLYFFEVLNTRIFFLFFRGFYLFLTMVIVVPPCNMVGE
jgi:hypothetical protein